MKTIIVAIAALLATAASSQAERPLVDDVDPLLGAAPPADVAGIGFSPAQGVWAGLTFPGASKPNGLGHLGSRANYRSGIGYEFENRGFPAFKQNLPQPQTTENPVSVQRLAA